ncbi:hypothetical protein [Auraticoccus monumenti]|uniref:Uncharacterized protein n=1 Tax=Auraticoccus monumenti TaxID=675864 RepID=A0A1G7B4R0_9ACTN|nr:hypothetical protein [Auraticoccus monumenti]SDE22104.1 hypothetical protein SAMN04489747_2843 [Auraticoccus monumenti]
MSRNTLHVVLFLTAVLTVAAIVAGAGAGTVLVTGLAAAVVFLTVVSTTVPDRRVPVRVRATDRRRR